MPGCWLAANNGKSDQQQQRKQDDKETKANINMGIGTDSNAFCFFLAVCFYDGL